MILLAPLVIRGEIRDIYNLLQTRHQRGEDITALIRSEGEKLE